MQQREKSGACRCRVYTWTFAALTASSPAHTHYDRRRLVISTTSSLLILILCMFLPAGTWAWTRGWLFLGVLLASSTLLTFYLLRVNTDVIAGRVNRH